MYQCIGVIVAGFVWLGYESDWFRVRLPIGAFHAFCVWFAPEADDTLEAAFAEVEAAKRSATNDYKRGGAAAKEYIYHLIATCDDANEVLHWTRAAIDDLIFEMGERMAPYRNASRRGHKGGYESNPYRYPFYGVPAKHIEGMYHTYLQFSENLAFELETRTPLEV